MQKQVAQKQTVQKQADYIKLIFLKKFTKELLINSLKDSQMRQRIATEKIKQKFMFPPQEISVESAFRRVMQGSSAGYQASMAPTPPQEIPIPRQQIPARMQAQMQMHNIPSQSLLKKPISELSTKKQRISEIRPIPIEKPMGFNLGRLEPLAQDNSIQLIECPGPGKNILVKRYNKPNMTKIVLNQSEVSEIIEAFSKEARIPIVGGILKAAVGNLVISAVISDFVGSRFIITKITPYSMIIN